jgi:saccharopine dehydrogenase (NAD+, L-lysine-forming)
MPARNRKPERSKIMPPNPDSGADPTRIVFFGLGAVGSALLICLSELAERDGVPLRFVVYVKYPDAARDALFHAERLFDRIDFIGVSDFAPVFGYDPSHHQQLAGAAMLVNAALPEFNGPIIQLGLRIGAHTVDLASDIYEAVTERTLTFSQYNFDAALRERGVAALINLGISPGVTNFLIGRRVHELLAADRKDLEIESIDLYLLEDIDSDQIIFSWSPIVALEELAQQPRIWNKGWMQVLEPFTAAREYDFPHEPQPIRQYPLYQEELLSLHRSFPDVESIGVYAGGSEVELVKALFQLNLLSKRSLPNQPELTVEAMVRAILPGMNKPRRIEEHLRNGVIRRAHFAAAAEIRVSESVRNERQTVIETVGLSYLRYHDLLHSPYAGATYISYPTAVGAAILAWHALAFAREHPTILVGVITGEDLARILPRPAADAIRRDLVAWDIDLFESVRDASEG